MILCSNLSQIYDIYKFLTKKIIKRRIFNPAHNLDVFQNIFKFLNTASFIRVGDFLYLDQLDSGCRHLFDCKAEIPDIECGSLGR